LQNPVVMQLGMVGSHARINFGTTSMIVSQGYLGSEYFDMVNIDKYDTIVGTPSMHCNKVVLDFDNKCVMVNGNKIPEKPENKPWKGKGKMKYTDEDIPSLRQGWYDEFESLLQGVPEKMPPFCEVNHKILLIDPDKQYHYHLPWCSNSLKMEFSKKVEKYTRAGWWMLTSASQAAPMLCLPK
ncbi:hypothetical protein ARMGADRAFT_856439, partial [Armillaria gallica]